MDKPSLSVRQHSLLVHFYNHCGALLGGNHHIAIQPHVLQKLKDLIKEHEDKPTKEGISCPFCKATDTVQADLIDWTAKSNDTSDKNNTAQLMEHQCSACTKSFWTS